MDDHIQCALRSDLFASILLIVRSLIRFSDWSRTYANQSHPSWYVESIRSTGVY